MTDSVAVFPPGYRLTDSSTGAVLSGAVIRFYDAGTSTPKTVYSDADLLTEIGTSVTTDSLGYPTSDGSTKTLVYVGTAEYKITIETSTGTVLATHDNVKGAVATVDSSDLSVDTTRPVITKSLNYTVLTTDSAKIIAVNCSGGDVTLTLPSAVTAGDGWFVTVQHAGSANQTLIATVSSQTISSGVTSYSTVMALALNGEEVTIVSDGGNWRVISHTGPHIKIAQGVLTIVDRLTAPPGSEVQGSLYLISGTPTGAWSSFAQHDIVQYTSSAWVRFTPPTDCGWLAYVQDENRYYRFVDSAWATDAASDTAAGTLEIAVQSEIEAAASNALAVTPGRLHYHPGVAKFWAKISVSAGVPSVSASYNVTSVTDTNTGVVTVTIGTDFSSNNWACLATVEEDSGSSNVRVVSIRDAQQAAGSVQLRCQSLGGSNTDPAAWHVAGFGDQG